MSYFTNKIHLENDSSHLVSPRNACLLTLHSSHDSNSSIHYSLGVIHFLIHQRLRISSHVPKKRRSEISKFRRFALNPSCERVARQNLSFRSYGAGVNIIWEFSHICYFKVTFWCLVVRMSEARFVKKKRTHTHLLYTYSAEQMKDAGGCSTRNSRNLRTMYVFICSTDTTALHKRRAYLY